EVGLVVRQPRIAGRLPVLEVEAILLLLANGVERAVVVDVAVLVDLDERRTPVRRGTPKHAGQPGLVGVDRAGDERRLRAERDGERIERVVHAAERRRAGDLSLLT